MRLAQMLLLIPLLATPGCAPFAGGNHIVTPSAAACSTLIPDEWRQGVAGADLPDGNVLGDWIVFGDAQTGKLDQANSRTRDSIGIISRCEARDAAAVHQATRRRLFGVF